MMPHFFGTTSYASSGELKVGTGTAKTGKSGAISITVGTGDKLAGGVLTLRAGASTTGAATSGGHVFVKQTDCQLANDKKLHAVSTLDGSQRWEYVTGDKIRSSPAISVDGKTIFVGSNDKKLHAIAVTTWNPLLPFAKAEWIP